MQKQFSWLVWIALLATLFETACRKDGLNTDAVIIRGTGDISGPLDEFRLLIGTPVNTTPGLQGGRREINWDAVPDSLSATSLPADFFNPVGPGAPVSRQPPGKLPGGI